MAFWATVALVVVLVGYPLSAGPAVWLSWNVRSSHTVIPFQTLYEPLFRVVHNCPETIDDLVMGYVHSWRGDRHLRRHHAAISGTSSAPTPKKSK